MKDESYARENIDITEIVSVKYNILYNITFITITVLV